MEPNPRISAATIAMLTLMVLAMVYFSGYLLSGSVESDATTTIRAYKSGWEATLYIPASHLESLLTGKEVASITVTERR